MEDEEKLCVCGRPHPWGKLRTINKVPQYGGRPIPGCDDFRAASEVDVPAFVQDTRELWARTGDLDPQTELATRTVVARLRSLQSPSEQWVESLGFIFSQLSTVRGAMVRNTSTFQRLTAHADELVESMSHVTQLSERLEQVNQQLAEIREKFDRFESDRRVKYSAEIEAYGHFGLLPFPDYPRDSSMSAEDEYATVQAKLHYPSLGERREEPVAPEYRDADEDDQP